MVKSLELKERLHQAIQNKGLNTSQLAKASDVRSSFIYDILNGKSTNPSIKKMAKLSEVLGIELSDLMGFEQKSYRSQSDESEYVTISTMLEAASLDGHDSTIEEKQGKPYYFRKHWIKERLQTRPENLRMIFVQGDSMEPTLCQGDMVLIDITKKRPSPPGIFILFDGLGLVAKRLEVQPNSTPPTLRILSDNAQYKPYEQPLSDIDITGRVVWFAREI